MPITYEPDILEEFARRLYKQAEELTAQYVLGGIFGGGLFGGIVGFGVGFADRLLANVKGSTADIVATGIPFAIAGRSRWGRSMLARRGGYAVQKLYREQGRIGDRHPAHRAAEKSAKARKERREQERLPMAPKSRHRLLPIW